MPSSMLLQIETEIQDNYITYTLHKYAIKQMTAVKPIPNKQSIHI